VRTGRRWRTAATSLRSWGSLKGLGMKPVAPTLAAWSRVWRSSVADMTRTGRGRTAASCRRVRSWRVDAGQVEVDKDQVGALGLDHAEALVALLGGLKALDVGQGAEGVGHSAGGGATVVAVDRLLDVGGGGHGRADRAQLGGQADVVQGEHVGRVGQGDREHVVGQAHRDGAVALGDVAGEHGQDLLRDGEAPEVQEGQAELVGEGARDLDLVGQAEGGDDLPQPPSTALVLALTRSASSSCVSVRTFPATSTSPSRRRPPGAPPAAQPLPISAVSPLLVASRRRFYRQAGAPR
jgi:hypothetical protein